MVATNDEKRAGEVGSAETDKPADDQRKKRLAEALRRNLRRRKEAGGASVRQNDTQPDEQ